jgi:hypothetical protein
VECRNDGCAGDNHILRHLITIVGCDSGADDRPHNI